VPVCALVAFFFSLVCLGASTLRCPVSFRWLSCPDCCLRLSRSVSVVLLSSSYAVCLGCLLFCAGIVSLLSCHLLQLSVCLPSPALAPSHSFVSSCSSVLFCVLYLCRSSDISLASFSFSPLSSPLSFSLLKRRSSKKEKKKKLLKFLVRFLLSSKGVSLFIPLRCVQKPPFFSGVRIPHFRGVSI